MKKLYFLVSSFFMYAFCIAQTTVVLTADRDNTMYSAFTTKSNGMGQYFFVGQNSASNDNSIQRALLHFNTASIPTNALVTAATLTLVVTKSASTQTGINLHKVSADWGEGTSDAGGNEGTGANAATNDAT